MASAETALSVPNAADSDSEEEVIVRRKGKINLVLFENEGDERTVEDEQRSESVFDSVDKSTDVRSSESKENSLPSPSATTVSQAEDVRSEEKQNQNPKKFTDVVDSDSDDEQIFNSLVSSSQKSGNSVDATHTENNILKPNKISSLIDSDSEDENPPTHKYGGSSEEDETATKLNTAKKNVKPEKKKRTGSIRAAKDEAMREIQSESQRFLRESEVRLPYHKPKQRTLQEFLKRRKGLPMLPTALTTAAKVKMAGELVGKVLEEKEKEAELFYKSSSDSDNEEGGMHTELSTGNIEPDGTVIKNNFKDNSRIEETQKGTRNNLENHQGNKETFQQGDKSLGLPRKLFNGSENETETIEDLSPVENSDSEEMTRDNEDCNQRHKEFKQGLKTVSMPRKLFGSECDEPIDVDHKRTTADGADNDRLDEIQEVTEASNSQLRISQKADHLVENEAIVQLEKYSNVQRNESMEDEAEDFELKMSEDLCDRTNENRPSQDIAGPKNGTANFETITTTPFINNREEAKLNEKAETDLVVVVGDNKVNSKDMDLSSTSSINTKSSCNDEESELSNVPIGHVYGLPLPEFHNNKPCTTKSRILGNIMKITPKLQGSPDMVIELSPQKVGIDKLMKRLLHHSVVKKAADSSPEVTVMRTEQTEGGLKVINEVLPFKMLINEKNDDPELSKPGAKLVRLKEKLQQQMAIQRTKEWKQKELEVKTTEDDDVFEGELSDCGMEDEDDENASSDEAEGESDEDDLPMKEAKVKTKSPFVDEEVEVSGEESEEREDIELSEEEDQRDVDNDHSFDGDDPDEEHEESQTEASPRNKSWKLKRIVKAFEDDDSSDSEEKGAGVSDIGNSNSRVFTRTKTDVDMFATDNNSDDEWLSGTEGDLPVYQQRIDERSQSCATPSVAGNSFSIVSPITQLTALNTGSESVNRDLRSGQDRLQLIAPLSVETTPIEAKCYRECDSEKREKLQKKLFDDTKGTPNDAELMDLCSGQFTDNTSDNRELNRLMDTARKTDVSDAELLDVCSGIFATQPLDIKKLEGHKPSIETGKSQEVLMPPSHNTLSSSYKSPREDSQKPDTISNILKIVFSSDEENEAHNSQEKTARRKKLKKKVRKLKMSDDEEESENACLSDFDERENDEEKFIDYDSEENEIVVPKKDVRKTAAHFLDKEAELSESEWGSADEDERDLDKLDYEEGDLEDIDQDQVKKQLEKLHMRQVLDADQREVRLLKEILLEDGELHSDNPSRQRKFKWRNIDELEEGAEDHSQTVDEDTITADPNEAESELEWRKQRLEREKFLEEQRIKEAAEDVEEQTDDSQLFQLGMRALKKNKSNKSIDKQLSQSVVNQKSQTSVTRHTLADLFASPGCGKKTYALQNAIHRGSFLARGEESLARLSVITKQNSDPAIIRTKKSRNFVFAHLSPAVEQPDENDAEFNDETSNKTADATLRKRKPTFSLTPVASKKSKNEYEQSKPRSKLFN